MLLLLKGKPRSKGLLTAYSLACYVPAEESKHWKECGAKTFDGTKSNSMFDQVNKWFILQDLESRLEIERSSIRLPGIFQLQLYFGSGTHHGENPFCIFRRISSIAKEIFLFFSFNKSFQHSSIFLTLIKLFGTGYASQIASWRLFSGMYFSNWVVAYDASSEGRTHLNWSSFDIRYNMEPLSFLVFFLTRRARRMRRQWRKRQIQGSSPLSLSVLLLTSLFPSSK